MLNDTYEVLGLPRTATTDDIKKAHRKLVRTSHPDLHPDDAGAEARFKTIAAACEIPRPGGASMPARLTRLVRNVRSASM